MTTIVPIVPLKIDDLTQATLEGSGIFDVLMRANKVHLEAEFNKNRIKGPEYSTVYLGALQSVMSTGLSFLFQNQKAALEAQLLEQQIILAGVAVEKARVELQMVTASLAKIPLEILQLEAQTGLVKQQTANALAELEIIKANGLKIPAEIALITQQKLNLVTTELQIQAQTKMITQQALNAVIEGTVLSAQKCKLDAEFDLLREGLLKSAQETALLTQKVATEKAQTLSTGVDEDSVLGKQKKLYQAQTDGFSRDAEQKAAKVMVDSWNVRRTTDETGTVADGTNQLNDASVGRAVGRLLTGINA